MTDLVAKKYTKAIFESFSKKEVSKVFENLKQLSIATKDEKIAFCLQSPFLSEDTKAEVLLSVFEKPSAKFSNLIKLLARNGRIFIIDELVKQIENRLLQENKRFIANLYTSGDLDSATITNITKRLSKALNTNIEIKIHKTSEEGIRLSVDDLGVEISFSKAQFLKELNAYILNAI